MRTLIDSISALTGLDSVELIGIANRAQRTYRKYDIPKKKTGMRRIYHPAKETKLLQYAAIDLLISKMPVHEAAVGFIPGLKSPLRVNAERHAVNPYLLRVDFKDFFPSIRPADFFRALDAALPAIDMKITRRDRAFMEKILFVKLHDGTFGLPIGAPASPVVSNVVMLTLDSEIQNLAEAADAVYTRYADDLVFSTGAKHTCTTILEDLGALLYSSNSPAVTLNDSKTCFMSRNCRRAVTGLIITPEGGISIGRSNKRKLKSLLCQSQYGDINSQDAAYLQGYLAFLLDVEPSYFNRLALKYSAEVLDEALKRRQSD